MDITFWNELTVHISPDDWDFLCKNRFLSDNPSLDEVQAEFVSGTGISPNKKHLWNEADARFAEYVQELREIRGNFNKNNNEIIINAPEMSENNITGKLLEKFTPGTKYDENTETWSMSEEVRQRLLRGK